MKMKMTQPAVRLVVGRVAFARLARDRWGSAPPYRVAHHSARGVQLDKTPIRQVSCGGARPPVRLPQL